MAAHEYVHSVAKGFTRAAAGYTGSIGHERVTFRGLITIGVEGSGGTCKSLNLKGEMLERSIRHAWKLILLARANAHRNPPTHSRSTTSRNNDVHRSVPVNHAV
jgi:hypothetical protein